MAPKYNALTFSNRLLQGMQLYVNIKCSYKHQVYNKTCTQYTKNVIANKMQLPKSYSRLFINDYLLDGSFLINSKVYYRRREIL